MNNICSEVFMATMNLVIPIGNDLLIQLITLASANGRTLPGQVMAMLSEESTLSSPPPTTPTSPANNPLARPSTRLGIAETMDIAIAGATAFEKDKEFLLRDTMPREVWVIVENTRAAGHQFKRRIEQAGVATWIGKTESNHAVYRRN
jgi:hypothetical protein